MSDNPHVALYLRVSTRDKNQDPKNQLLALQEFCESKHWKIEQVYEDRESAGAGKRLEAYQRLFRDAASPTRKWDLLLFWSLDRFSREGPYQTLHRLRELDQSGVRFLSLQEQYLDTLGPFREAVIAILGSVASLERDRISERVKAGIARSRSEGRSFGRKPVKVDGKRLKQMRKKNYSLGMMAHALGVSRSTVLRRLRQLA